MNHSKHPQIVVNRATTEPMPQNFWTDEDRMNMRLGFKNQMKLKRNKPTRNPFAKSNHQTSWHQRMFLGIYQGIASFFQGKNRATKKRRASNQLARKSKQTNRGR